MRKAALAARVLIIAAAGRRHGRRLMIGPAHASETFDVGVDLGSVVSLDYFDRRPFRFNGKIEKVEVNLK